MLEPVEVRYYQTQSRRVPFRDWLQSITDPVGFAAIRTRLIRLERGLVGDWRAVGGGVCELRMDVGAGHRVYFGRRGPRFILILCGGTKRTQGADIEKAKEYWSDYEKRTGGGSRKA
jgi:putative addiction module killer protein